MQIFFDVLQIFCLTWDLDMESVRSVITIISIVSKMNYHAMCEFKYYGNIQPDFNLKSNVKLETLE